MDGDGVALSDHLGHAVALAGKLESLGSGNIVHLEEKKPSQPIEPTTGGTK